MQQTLPVQYHYLAPFRQHFEQGVPALIYHKVGPRPGAVRLKGMYVSIKRFTLQMKEFHAAGFSTVDMAKTNSTPGNPGRHFAITFDDGYRNVFKNALEPMARYHFQAIQFLVPNLIGKVNEWDVREGEASEALMDEAEIRDWLGAGHQIGAHTMSHARLTRLSLRDAREEISSSKKSLEDNFGVPIEHFCYPYGDWNTAVRDLVQESGYKTACSTELGLNTQIVNPLSLFRIGVRYPSCSFKAIRARLFS